jgi:hypothetical protein
MADPVSSVAYAVESALNGLDGGLSDLFPTMALVIDTIAVVAATHHQLVCRFPCRASAALAVELGIGLPPDDSTLVAGVGRGEPR